jgi:hypothetical protein
LIEKIGEQINQITRKIEFVQRLKLLFAQINEWKSLYTQEVEEEEVLAEINLDKGRDLDVQVKNLSVLKDLKVKLEKIDSNKVETTKKLQECNDSEEQKVNEYVQVLQEAKKCPSCLQDVDEEQLDLIRKQL